MNPVKKRKPLIIHPFLLAPYTALLIFSQNLSIHNIYGSFLAVSLRLLFALCLFILVHLVIKDKLKAAFIVSLFLIWFFFWGYVYGDIAQVALKGIFKILHPVGFIFFVLAWTVFFILCGIYVLKKSDDCINPTKILNTFSLTLIVICFVVIASACIKGNISKGQLISLLNIEREWGETIDNIKTDVEGVRGDRPDIYYLILDTYVGFHTLKKFLNFENSDFYNYLRKKGFYIAERSLSNYATTKLSLAASLNMGYLEDTNFNMLSRLRKLGKDPPSPFFLVSKNKAEHLLELLGYKCIHIGIISAHGKSFLYEKNSFIRKLRVLFLRSLLGKSILDIFIRDCQRLDYYYREEILYNFSTLSDVISMPGPKFVFAYIYCPHRPFVFGRDGQRTHIFHFGYKIDWSEYIPQLMYVNKRLKEFLETVLSKSNKPPVIILQGDHGFKFDNGVKLSAAIEYGMPILNAYYLPGKGSGLLYDSITPVNTFRTLFNYYFKTHYDLLEDRSWFSNVDKPYDLVDAANVFKHVDFICSKNKNNQLGENTRRLNDKQH